MAITPGHTRCSCLMMQYYDMVRSCQDHRDDDIGDVVAVGAAERMRGI